jgi:hypothetical protein
VKKTITSVVSLQDLMSTIKAHPNGTKIIQEYAATNSVTEHKDLLVRIVASYLIDQNGGSL